MPKNKTKKPTKPKTKDKPVKLNMSLEDAIKAMLNTPKPKKKTPS